MQYLSTTITSSGVFYAYTKTGVGFSYQLSTSDDMWVNGHLSSESLRPFMKQHHIKDVSEFDFTHVLEIPGHEIAAY